MTHYTTCAASYIRYSKRITSHTSLWFLISLRKLVSPSSQSANFQPRISGVRGSQTETEVIDFPYTCKSKETNAFAKMLRGVSPSLDLDPTQIYYFLFLDWIKNHNCKDLCLNLICRQSGWRGLLLEESLNLVTRALIINIFILTFFFKRRMPQYNIIEGCVVSLTGS